ncbi:AraC family transcriptional regulator [Mangrovimicrobium sediminis]|uniref:AraC family transcriptional regulator n=2 Tax=Mangrovimicrobium sediminis TaxID=2562682 RepID=A0A4Z0LV59_9GAMM|nr:AraC family transcriptional regulator [Haliea sp. SAOS-164]
MQVDAELAVPLARAQLVRFDMHGPVDNVMQRNDAYWLDLCLTPRPDNARARYCDRWSPQRFERLGKVFLLPAGETVQARSDGGQRQTSILCHLNPDNVQQWFDGELSWTDQRLRASLDITETSIHGLMLRLAEELRHPGFASEALVELIAAQLAIELRRYCSSIDDREDSGGLAPWRLRLIDERLHEDGSMPSLAELAELCRISVRQLTRGFRASRGCSVGDYIAQNRLSRARQLLATDKSIKAIACELGFSSPSSFGYAFRRDTGETPGEYRERVFSIR